MTTFCNGTTWYSILLWWSVCAAAVLSRLCVQGHERSCKPPHTQLHCFGHQHCVRIEKCPYHSLFQEAAKKKYIYKSKVNIQSLLKYMCKVHVYIHNKYKIWLKLNCYMMIKWNTDKFIIISHVQNVRHWKECDWLVLQEPEEMTIHYSNIGKPLWWMWQLSSSTRFPHRTNRNTLLQIRLGSRCLAWPFSAEIGIKSNFGSFNPHSYSLFITKNHKIKKSNLSFAFPLISTQRWENFAG